MSEQGQTTEQGEVNATQGTANAAGAPPSNGQEPKGGDARFTQADVERIVAERLERAQRKADEKAAKAREDAEAKALADQQEFKTLAEKRGAKLAELEGATAQQAAALEALQADKGRLEKALRTQVDALRANVPPHVATLLDKLDVAEQLEWLAANGDKLGGAQAAPKPGVPPTPKPRAGETDAQDEEARRAIAASYRDF